MAEHAGTGLTTGANSGIGLATVLELARLGFDSVGSVRSAAKGRTVRKAAKLAGVQVRTVLLDVKDAQAIALWSRVVPTEVKDRLARLSLGL
jgi:NAD(P)-dependent dehydrogenase (short-subunit alcohol dehydrogenase family)